MEDVSGNLLVVIVEVDSTSLDAQELQQVQHRVLVMLYTPNADIILFKRLYIYYYFVYI